MSYFLTYERNEVKYQNHINEKRKISLMRLLQYTTINNTKAQTKYYNIYIDDLI